jgi:F-type H+-transporting ATPase subunit b
MDNRQILSEIIVQVLGFGIVFLILKHFAWSKLLGAIDLRRKKIEDDLSAVEKKRRDIEQMEREYRQRLEHIEQEARLKIQEAAHQGLGLAKEIQDKARADAQRMIERAKAEIDQEVAKARVTLRDDIVEMSGLVTEKILKEKLDAREHRKIVDQFIKELEKIS